MVSFLNPKNPLFPAAETASNAPNGLLAAGGNLLPDTLRKAYAQGIFPWFDDESPILWWSPDPREAVLPGAQHWSSSMRRFARRSGLRVTSDRVFDQVVENCRNEHAEGVWITDEMRDAYCALHREGDAHSVEIWAGDDLVGGLYGVATGRIFCGESMFHRAANASKLAFLYLADTLFAHGFVLIDCQFRTDHLRSLGSRAVSRRHYLQLVRENSGDPPSWPKTFKANLV